MNCCLSTHQWCLIVFWFDCLQYLLYFILFSLYLAIYQTESQLIKFFLLFWLSCYPLYLMCFYQDCSWFCECKKMLMNHFWCLLKIRITDKKVIEWQHILHCLNKAAWVLFIYLVSNCSNKKEFESDAPTVNIFFDIFIVYNLIHKFLIDARKPTLTQHILKPALV